MSPPQDESTQAYSVFRPSIKALSMILASVAGFMSPLGSNIYMPALPQVTEKLSITHGETLLSVTMYMIFQGVAPSFWGPLSDTFGRRPIIMCTFLIFLAANLGLAFVNVFWGLLVLRMLQACGAASAIAIGAGVVSDMAPKSHRGRYMSYFQFGALIGPCVGPIAGGLLAKRWEWHSVFFFLSAINGILLLCFGALLPETLRALVGNGSKRPVGIWKTWLPISLSVEHDDAENQEEKSLTMEMPSHVKLSQMGFHKPWLMFLEPDIALLILSYSLPFTTYSVSTATLSETLSDNYGYNMIVIGLCYLPLGAGFAVGCLLGGRLVDWEYRRSKEKHGDQLNLFIARLKYAPLFNTLFCIGFIAVEWCLDKKTHIAAPMIVFFFGMCFLLTHSVGLFYGPIYVHVRGHNTHSSNSLLVDLYRDRAASVTAALNIGRCILGAILVAVTQYSIDGIGLGWTYTIYALISIFMPLPVLYTLCVMGPKWEKRRTK